MQSLPRCEKNGHVYREMLKPIVPQMAECCIYCGAAKPEHLVSDMLKEPPPQTITVSINLTAPLPRMNDA